MRSALAVLALGAVAGTAAADEFAERDTYTGRVDFFVTGAPLGTDTDGDHGVDTLAVASASVPAASLPAGATLQQAFLYWSGTIPDGGEDIAQFNCVASPHYVTSVMFTPPGGAPTAVAADACHCSGGRSSVYDVQVCRADVTGLIGA